MKNSKMSARAITGRLHFDLENALLGEIESFRSGDPFSPIYILVGSNLLGLHLKKRLAREAGGLFNVRFVTFIDLVDILERSSLPRTRRRLPVLAEKVILEEVLSSGDLPGVFSGVAGMRGFSSALLATFTDLAEGGCTSRVAGQAGSGSSPYHGYSERVVGVLSLYSRFRERVDRLGGDLHTGFMRAVELAGHDHLHGPLLAYGFYDFNEMQWRLIEAFAGGPGVTLLIPRCTEEPYRFVDKALSRLERNGFDIVDVPVTEGDGRVSPQTVLMDAPGKEEEIRGIVRRILVLARDRGVRFSEIGILLPSMDVYWPMLQESLDDAGIPYFAKERPFALGSRAARGALSLLGLLRGDMEREAVVEFILSAPLSVHGDSSCGFDPFSLWTAESARAGMIGENGWVRENRELVERVEREREGGRGTEEVLASVRLVGDVLARIEEARAGLGGRSKWIDFSCFFNLLLRDLFEASGDVERVCGLVESLGELDQISAPVSFDTFSGAVESVFNMPHGARGRFEGEGVNVLTVGQARGLSFRVVFMPGLSEGVLPAVVRQDPFLKDDERAGLGSITGGSISLSGKMERLDEEALIFVLALDSAVEELVCSYPRFEEATGKEKIRSSFLRYVKGFSLDGDQDSSVVRARLPREMSQAGSFEPTSENDYSLQMTVRYKAGSGFLPVSSFFWRGIELVKSRWGRRKFTPYDGVFSSRRALSELHRMLEERDFSFSPTSMESYAGCPFAYFLEGILGVESAEQPERIITITPLERGRIVHEILARLYGRLREGRLLPLDPESREEVLGIAEQVVDGVLTSYEGSTAVGLPFFWEVERWGIAESIRTFLDEELGEGEGFVPSYFELPFGRLGGGSLVSFECGGRDILFHGRIDRIDTGAGGSYRVTDYKTGKLRGKDQDMAGGKCLQLPIYLLAASKILGRDIEAGRARYRRVGIGSGRREISFSGELWGEGREELGRILAVITSGIERGLFFAPAESDGCEYCAVRSACPSGKARLFEAKAAGDGRCHDYLSLRGLAGEGT